MCPTEQNELQPIDQMIPVVVGGHKLGLGERPVFWPDIDVYFRQDESQALRLIDGVAQAGCGFLKGAVLHRADLCLRGARSVCYYDAAQARFIEEPYDQVIARHVVPLNTMARLMSHAQAAGLSVVLSVYDSEGLEFARSIGAVAVKIPSSNITHRALIESVAQSGLPVVIDTGRSRFEEIKHAVQWAKAQGAGARLIVQHAPPGPPARADRFHMRMLRHLSQTFRCPVGLSDHHSGLDMLPMAVALGAAVVEKGLTIDRAAADIDIAHALSVSELPRALRLLQDSWDALGAFVRPDDEVAPYPVDRMCIVAARDIALGEIITRDALGFAFPPDGIGAELVYEVLGGRAKQLIAARTPLTWDVLVPCAESE